MGFITRSRSERAQFSFRAQGGTIEASRPRDSNLRSIMGGILFFYIFGNLRVTNLFAVRIIATPFFAGFGLSAVIAGNTSALAARNQYHFHHDSILGTSFDLAVRTDDMAVAERAERAALCEIERLRKILSTYDPYSEISQINSSESPMRCSPELLEVLNAYQYWETRSHGAFSGRLGRLIRIWHEAERIGTPPSQGTLANFFASHSKPSWTFNSIEFTITKHRTQPLNLDSLGKGYIIGKAAAAARRAAPSAAGFLLNIGGDILASGNSAIEESWRIGIANPRNSADNAAPITQVQIVGRAISTSGSYERGYQIAGRRYSHILDPRTGFSAEGIASATVVAADNATANALATSLCVLKPEEGLALVNETPAAECFIIASNGAEFRSPLFAAIEIPATGDTKKSNETKPTLWPKNFQVTVTLTLKGPAAGGGGYRRPYIAVWAENEQGKRVRTISIWGNKQRYFPDLYTWSYGEKDRLDWAASIARATRPPGRYRIAWDGRDDSGNPVPREVYTIWVEANREHGTYAKESGKIVCRDELAKGAIRSSTEFEEAPLAYGSPSAE